MRVTMILPALTEAIKKLTTDDRKRAFQDRGTKLAAANQKAAERARVDATYAWDASPISLGRLSAEVWNAVKNEAPAKNKKSGWKNDRMSPSPIVASGTLPRSKKAFSGL